MPVIRSQLMAHIRAHALATYTDTCLIEKNVEVIDNQYGSTEPGWETVGMDIPCRLIMLNSSNQSVVEEIGSQDAMLDSYQLELAYNQEIERDYRVTINGGVYQVTRIESELTDTAFKQVLITRKRG